MLTPGPTAAPLPGGLANILPDRPVAADPPAGRRLTAARARLNDRYDQRLRLVQSSADSADDVELGLAMTRDATGEADPFLRSLLLLKAGLLLLADEDYLDDAKHYISAGLKELSSVTVQQVSEAQDARLALARLQQMPGRPGRGRIRFFGLEFPG